MNRELDRASHQDTASGSNAHGPTVCANCDTSNRASAYFCKRCAFLLVDYCPRCHVDLPADAVYCDNCAFPLAVVTATHWPHPHGRSSAAVADGPDPAPLPTPRVRQPNQPPTDAGLSPPARAAAERLPPQPAPPLAESAIQRFLPRELAAKLEAARAHGAMQGERRVVTILFCDVKGSTAAAEKLDPEDWTEIINGAFEHMIQPVYRYEGLVARLMGDGILAFFGAPIAHEDDPERAVLAGLDIVAGIAPYREEIRQQWGIDVNVRVGINTGLVVVGAVGSDLRMEYTAMGDAINLAARMEQTATPGTIQIAHDTYKLIQSLFECEELGGIDVKGKAEPVLAYRVVRRRAEPGRARGIEGLEATLVGRVEEMARLEAAVANLHHGVGGIICLIGAAGLGKSRLIQELKTRLQQALSVTILDATAPDAPESAQDTQMDTAQIGWIETASHSYESSHPYALFQHLFRQLNGIAAVDSAEQFWAKVTPLTERFSPARRAPVVRMVATLFGLPDPSGQLPLEGESFKRELFTIFSEIGQVRFRNRPTLLVLDDLHWTDPGSIELLLHLLPIVETSPIVLLCAFRPDRDAPCYRVKQQADAEFHHRYTEINLRPLSEQESDELVDRLLAIAELPHGLRARIQERAGGNPFFVEEVVRSLIENGAVIAEDRPSNGELRRYWRAKDDGAKIEIPDNLQGLLAARIDRLEEETRQIMQMASVIGRSFHHRVLTEIGRQDALPPPHVEDQIGRLVRLEMIQEAARVPEVEYRFRNPLTQEIAYRTILNRQRREFHARVGKAMEVLFAEQLTELAPRLAFHFHEADQAEKAFHYYTLAGDNAFRLFANDEAAHHYAHALEWASQVEPSNRQLIHLYRRRGRALELLLHHRDALGLYQELEALGSERQDEELRLAGIMAQGTVYYTGLFDLENAQLRSEEALDLARTLGDRVAEARSLWNLLLCLSFSEAPRALQLGQEGLQLARELASEAERASARHAGGEGQQTDGAETPAQDTDAIEHLEMLAFFLMDLFFPLVTAGQLETAFAYANEARERFEQIGNLAMVATSYSRVSVILWYWGRLDEAISTNDRAVEIDSSIGNDGGVANLSSIKLSMFPLTGEFDRFFATWQRVKEIWLRENRFPQSITDAYVIAAYAPLGAYTLMDEYLPLLVPDQGGVVQMITVNLLSVAARAYVQIGDLARAQRLLERCRPHVELGNLASFAEPQYVQAEAELALALGEAEEALAIVDEYLDRVQPLGMAGHLPAKLLVKGRALLELGQTEEALAQLREAHQLASDQPARTFLWEICAELAPLEMAQENHTQAAALRAEARTAIQFIADHAGSDELRATFLARPDIRALLDEEAALR